MTDIPQAMLDKLVEDGVIPDVQSIGVVESAIIGNLNVQHRGLTPEASVLLNAGYLLRVVSSCVEAASGFKA